MSALMSLPKMNDSQDKRQLTLIDNVYGQYSEFGTNLLPFQTLSQLLPRLNS
jgi:hypothetical protein